MIVFSTLSKFPDSLENLSSVSFVAISKGDSPIAFSKEEKVLLDSWNGWNWGKNPLIVQSFVQKDSVLFGIKEEKITIESLRKSVSKIPALASSKHRKKILLDLLYIKDLVQILHLCERDFLQAVIEGVYLACYRFDEYKTVFPDGKFSVEELIVVVPQEYHQQVTEIVAICESVYWARDLGNEPANIVNAQYCKQWNEENSQKYGFTTKHLDKSKMKALGMNGILAVNQGSYNEPYLIINEYMPVENQPPILLVGKGVTFDTGGISIKPSSGMWEMKMDMCGAGAVLSVMSAVARLQWKINLVVIAPCVENMPGGHAQRPGDILRMYSGKTVEVDNTDAEGRLILADALWYGLQTYKPKCVVDIATLTGACVVALGESVAGLYATTDELRDSFVRCGESTGETCWPMPLFPEYDKLIKSSVADIKNAGSRNAGSVTAAKFLQNFVDPNIPWVHLDVAGPAMPESPSDYKPTKGATGFGVRLLLQFLREQVCTK